MSVSAFPLVWGILLSPMIQSLFLSHDYCRVSVKSFYHTLINRCDSDFKMFFPAVNSQDFWSDFQVSVVFLWVLLEPTCAQPVQGQPKLYGRFICIFRDSTFCGYVLDFRTLWYPELHSLMPQSSKIVTAISAWVIAAPHNVNQNLDGKDSFKHKS